VSTTLIEGGPAGPDEAGGQYRNRILTDRTTWWFALGGRQCVLKGMAHAVVAGQMAMTFTAGVAAVEERDSLGNTGTSRGYTVWSDATTQVTFGAASASDRKDAVVVAFCDLAAGAGAFGTETSVVGGQLVVVPGVSGTTTPRTDSQIQEAVGSGGWVRLVDVLIPAGSTEISAANVTKNTAGYGPMKPYAEAVGTVDVTLNAQASNYAAITFPTGRFSGAPRVHVSLQTAPGGTGKFVPRAIAVTSTGANVYCYTGDGSTTTGTATVAWRAIQMTETSADG
jgi:hypothetical protein